MKDLPKNTEKFLSKWNGGKGELWDYTPTFQRLSIRIIKRSCQQSLFITCSPLISIHAEKIFWRDLKMRISVESKDPLLGSTFLLEDSSNGLKIKCMGIYFREVDNKDIQ